MALLLGMPILLAGLALLLPLFQAGGGGLLYLKWFVGQMDVAVAAAGCWVLLCYAAIRLLADKLFLRKSGDKVRVLS